MKALEDVHKEAETYRKKVGSWIVAGLETHMFWPTKLQMVEFNGRRFLLMPTEKDSVPAIALLASDFGLTSEQARSEIMRFASALSWRERKKIDIVTWGGGNRPYRLGVGRNNAITDFLSPDHLPAVSDERAQAALAFYREGISLENPFYAFLSCYKAFSIAVENRSERAKWINDRCETVRANKLGRGAKRLDELLSSRIDVGRYLFEHGRNAIAHADREPFVNPDKSDDHFRASRDQPLMEELAEIAIEETFGVKSLSTIWREHLYELEGFSKLLPARAVSTMRDGKTASEEISQFFPSRCLILAVREAERSSLGVCQLERLERADGVLIADFATAAATLRLRVVLDFSAQRLQFDPLNGVALDGQISNIAVIRESIAWLKFQYCVLRNGSVEVWDETGMRRLGESEPYMPLNMYVEPKFFEQHLRAYEALLNTIGADGSLLKCQPAVGGLFC